MKEQTLAVDPAITDWVVGKLMRDHQDFVAQQAEALRGHALQLALACLQGREPTRACFQAWLAQGMALDTLYLQVLAPAAGLVGQWWQSDQVDFAHGTMGYNHLQDLLIEFSPQFLAQSGHSVEPGRRAFMIGQPQAQHALGLMMLAGRYTVSVTSTCMRLYSFPSRSLGIRVILFLKPTEVNLIYSPLRITIEMNTCTLVLS